jgi:hypothetical protein
MSDTCQTVRIAADNEQGFIVINETDFDSAVHTPYTDDAKQKPKRARSE